VGYKTTFRLLNSPDAKVPREGDPQETTITTLRNYDVREWVRQREKRGPEPPPHGQPLMTDPEFLCQSWAWVHNRGEKPSSGLVGIVMALAACEQVDVYGFQSKNYFSKTSRPHYYDWERPKKGREKVHPFAREVALYEQLENLGYIHFHSHDSHERRR